MNPHWGEKCEAAIRAGLPDGLAGTALTGEVSLPELGVDSMGIRELRAAQGDRR